ncbi:MAG: Si-specific NAD(P)(+) transhydrogenase [Acidobacteriota bacterium]|nr:Si-specific NAD(P)(+) transhydrogenase [Acidobacteriota bacterium]
MRRFDILVIGSGPAGQNAAIQGCKSGQRVAIVEKERRLGGACVHRGTIPSKTLRENALQMQGLKRHADAFQFSLKKDIQVSAMMKNLDQVLESHVKYMSQQLDQAGVVPIHGRARFLSKNLVEIMAVDGSTEQIEADIIVVATGSRPRDPRDVPVDHENIFDSDSVLSLIYLPRTMTVLGGGVIACEYASIFAALGTRVTIVDNGPKPMAFLDDALLDEFVLEFEANGGRYLGNQRPVNIHLNAMGHVVTVLSDDQKIISEKMLFAMGRVANLDSLGLENVGLEPTMQGCLEVDHYCRTTVSNIYAVGDVAGPPALAASAMEQGRRAVLHACGQEVTGPPENIPIGIYAIPELSSIGLTEAQATERFGEVLTGTSHFSQVARGQITGIKDGFLKIVCHPRSRRLLGVQIAGEGATELIHIGEMGLMRECSLDDFIEGVFNFPTFAEAYRGAALDALHKLEPAR